MKHVRTARPCNVGVIALLVALMSFASYCFVSAFKETYRYAHGSVAAHREVARVQYDKVADGADVAR